MEITERSKKFINMVAEEFGSDVVCIETDIQFPRLQEDFEFALLYDKKNSSTFVVKMCDDVEELKKSLELTQEDAVMRVSALDDLNNVINLLGMDPHVFTDKIKYKNDEGQEVESYNRFMTYNGHILTIVQPGFHYCKLVNSFVLLCDKGDGVKLIYTARDLIQSSPDGTKVHSKIELI